MGSVNYKPDAGIEDAVEYKTVSARFSADATVLTSETDLGGDTYAAGRLDEAVDGAYRRFSTRDSVLTTLNESVALLMSNEMNRAINTDIAAAEEISTDGPR